MGRVAKAGGSDSGRAAGERGKNIGKPRTKRRKRKDLEELHRNVLEAKRNLRMGAPQKKKKQTTLGKVLNNFADKRQENEETNQGIADKKSKKKKSRTICNRLLPEPILGIYQNGAKGREVRANRVFNKVNAARVQGDVLKLLNGDETDPKFSWNGEEKRAKKAKVSEALSPDESDYTSSSGGRANPPVLDETKGVKRKNGEKNKTNLTGDVPLAGGKDDQRQCLKKEKKIKRRLFESNEDQTDTICLRNSGDFLMGEIRFSPPRGIVRNVSPPGDCSNEKQRAGTTEEETREKSEKKLMPIEAANDANFWGCSASIYYERLCAMICAENFENNRGEQPRGPDPVVKIQRRLREFYRNACRYQPPCRKTVVAKGNKHRKHDLSKLTLPLEDSSLPSTTEIQACTATSTDSEFDQESSASEAIKVGSWRPRHSRKTFKPKDSSVLPDTNGTTSETKNHDKESQSNVDKPAVANKQKRTCEKTTDRVEKTINSVSLFLEKLRENNPLNGKQNIFQEEIAAARLAERNDYSNERILADYNAENPRRDLTFDMNLKNLVRRNTKHVPTILRRSNSRTLVDRVDEKKPPNNFAENQPKRRTRTIAALPQCLPPKHDDTDDLQTPSVVNHLGIIKKAKANILKSKLNFMRAKYRPDARSLSSEYRDLEKSRLADERKVSARQALVDESNTDNREWYHPNPVIRDERHVKDLHLNSRKEDEGKRVSFGKINNARDFQEPRPFESCFPEHQQPPLRMENPCPAETTSCFSSFQFTRPDVPKNPDSRDRQIFANEMAPPRLAAENQKTFVRSRYLPDNSSASTRLSRASNAQCVKDIQFPPEEYVERIPLCSETNNHVKNRSFELLPSYRGENTLSLDRLAMNEAAGCAQRCRGAVHHQRIRKPVMLFRPIQETRQQQEICDSRYRLSQNGDTTINDAVRDFRVLTFEDNRSPSKAPQRAEMCVHFQPQQMQSSSQPLCHRQLTDNRQRHSQEFDNRPTKYLAFDDNGRNPRRLPVYVNSAVNQAANSAIGLCNREVEHTKLFNGFAKADNTEMMRCREVDNARLQHTARLQCCGQQQQQHETLTRRPSQVTLMLPYNAAPLCQQMSNNLPATAATTSIKDIPRVVYSMDACETLVPAEMTYQLEQPLYAQSRHDNESLSKRVQLPDGRVGILVTENCSIDNNERGDSGAATLNFKRMDADNLIERNRSGLVNERIYY